LPFDLVDYNSLEKSEGTLRLLVKTMTDNLAYDYDPEKEDDYQKRRCNYLLKFQNWSNGNVSKSVKILLLK
jgi:hypothetical protein